MVAAVLCQGLKKRYGSQEALRGLDLEVPAGALFGFLGPNGAGKSTTLRILSGLVRADAGRAELHGIDARRRNRKPTAVGEKVQHAAARSEPDGEIPIRPLIEKESRLLSLAQVHRERLSTPGG